MRMAKRKQSPRGKPGSQPAAKLKPGKGVIQNDIILPLANC
jgi:hypothetical protein